MIWPVKAGTALLFFFVVIASSHYMNGNPRASDFSRNKAPIAEQNSVALAPFGTFYEDPEHLLTPDSIYKAPPENGFRTSKVAPNFGHSTSAYWFSVPLQNTRASPVEQVVSLVSPLADLVSFYVIQDGLIMDSYTTGDRVPFNIRRIPAPAPSLKLKIDPNSTVTLMIRQVSTSPISFNVNLYQPNVFNETHLRETAATMFYFGILTLLMLFSGYAFWMTKEAVFASYSAFLFFRVLLQASLTGYAFQYLFPNQPSIQNLNLIFFACATLILFALFTQQLFNITGVRQTLLKGLMTAGVIPVAVMFSDYLLALILVKLLGLFSMLYFLSLAIHYARKGTLVAKFYLISMSLLLLCSMYYLMSRFGWLPHDDLVVVLFRTGSMIEALLLVVLVAIRFEQETKQRALAEVQAQRHSEETNLLEQQLQHRAFHHAKTHLPNDLMFHQTYQTLHTSQGFHSHAVVFIKVYKLKEFDKTLGTQNSDRLSRLLAAHINTVLQPYPSIVCIEQSSKGPIKLATLDQASFLFLADVESERKIVSLVRSIAERLKQPFTFEAINLDLDIRLGIAFSDQPTTSPDPGKHLDELIRQAKIAGSQAHQKKRLFQSYSEDEDLFNAARLSLAAELRMALDNNELTLVYQPQVNLVGGMCVGLEALLRWRKPGVGPEEFVSVAEHNGLIKPLSLWVINKALKELQPVHQQFPGIQLSINISVLNLHEPGFVDAVAEALTIHQIPPERLTLEITESSIITNDQLEQTALNDLKALGVHLSIDDFGTGFSGLSQIHRLSVHELKIDKSFIFELAHQSSAETIVKASINIGHDLNMRVVAEGIEDETTESILKDLGCDIGQGFHYARPMPKDEILTWLSEQK